MDDQTIHRLNAINGEFYRLTATEFDETRGQPWPGWDRLLPYLQTPLHVLDVGCGNGRLGVFLAQRLTGAITYHGVDNNPALLTAAQTALNGLPGMTFTLETRDVVENPPIDGAYDLVAAFGLLHHIPGAAQRQMFMKALAERVRPGGLLAFACWRFYEYPRFRDRIIPWPDDLTVETHDYLLDWRRGVVARRYCHYVDDAEQVALVAAAGLTEIAAYRADGFTGDVNHYALLQRTPASDES